MEHEREGKDVLDKLDAGAPEFEKLVSTFIRAGREHITYEETQAGPALRTALTAGEASELGRKIERR